MQINFTMNNYAEVWDVYFLRVIAGRRETSRASGTAVTRWNGQSGQEWTEWTAWTVAVSPSRSPTRPRSACRDEK
jgi:hypothetical protein